MRKKIFTFLLALAASVGLMNAKVTWNSSNISDLNVHGYHPYSKEGVTLSANGDMIDAHWFGVGNENMDGIEFHANATGGFTFSNTLSKNFAKIEMFLIGSPGWENNTNLGSGWSFSWDFMNDGPITVTWTGNASTVDLLKDEDDFHGESVKSIVFYFEGDSQEPDPTYTIALQAGTANANKVTLSKTSAVEGATITVTPDEEYEITAFSAKYNTTEEAPSTLDPGTGAYSFTMPAYDVTIEATIALKPVPEGDIYAGFTATAGSGGFDNEGHANLVDNKFTSADWTKWCTNFDHMSVPTGETGDACWWIDFEASAALNPTGYILTTGNDTGNEHGRNPKNWVLKAKLNADDEWTTIATVTNDVTMKNKSFKDYKFFVDQSGTYQYFRFEVFANQGAGVMQLCELRLIGTEPVLVTTHTLQLHVNDALMGSLALQNPSNDIVDNGDGTYDVPEGAEVTILATPNEGYEFIGWKASSSICDFNECEFVALPTNANPLTVDMYQEAAFMAEFAAVAPADNSVKLYHNFSGDWMETEAFGIFDDYTSEYAKISMILEPGDYQFALKVGGELRGDGTAFSRNKRACILGEGLTANLTLNVDVKGTYRFYWFYDENRFAMDVPNVCGMYWQNVTAGNFEVTLGQGGEVTLPTVYTTNMGFASNIFNGVDQVRLVSTDETVATIEYTLSLDGLGTIKIHKAGECDIYAVHDITDYYCYDSVAFHLTVLPEPQPQPAEDVNITPNVDPDHAGVYYSTFFDSANKYALPAGVEAYVADLSGANLLLTKIADAGQTIPANVAVILKSTVTPFTLTVSDADAVTFTATNDLQGSDTQIATPANCYVLAGNDGVGFYHYTASMLNPHKAYVIYSGSQAPRRMPFIFDQATGVESVQPSAINSQKVIENGQLIIIRNGVRYNAAGQNVK